MRRVLLCLLLPFSLLNAAVRADEAAIREKLRSRVQVKFDDTPLVDVLKNMGEQAGVKFWINEEEIKGDGGTIEGTVTLDWGEMQLDSALYFILERMHELAAIPDENDVIVTTVTKRMERHTTRVYDLRTLIDGMQAERQPEKVAPHRVRALLLTMPLNRQMGWSNGYLRWFQELSSGGAGQGFFQFGGMGGQSQNLSDGYFRTIGEVIDPVWLHPKPIRRSELLTQLSHIATSMTEGYYGENGGSVMSLGEDSLIISASHHVHDQTVGLFREIQQMFSEDQSPLFLWALRDGSPLKDDDAIRKSLQQVGDFEAVDEPLGVVLNRLARKAGIRLWIDEKGILDDGGSIDIAVSISLNGLPYEKILSRLLNQQGLDYVIEEGVVLVNTVYKTYEKPYPAVYDTSGIPESRIPLPENYYPSIRNQFMRSQLIGILRSHLNASQDEDGNNQYGSAYMLTPSVMIVNQNQKVHRRLAKLLADLRQRKRPGGPVQEGGVYRPDLRPEFLTRVYPVFDPEAVEPSVTILKKLLANDQMKLIEVVKDSIVIQCSDEGHIRAEAYFEAIESAHRRRQERVQPGENPKADEAP